MRVNRHLYKFSLFLSLSILGLTSCSEHTLIDTNEGLNNEQWHKEDTLVVSFQLKDTGRYVQLFLNTRLTPEFPYSNMYFHILIQAPDGKKTEAVKTFDVTTKSGKWLGSGLGDLHAYSFPLYEDFIGSKTGTYKVRVVQNMRVDSLAGCHDRGLKVMLGQEIF